MSCYTETETVAERTFEASRPTCRKCGDYPINAEGLCEDCALCVDCEDGEGLDDWETLEGIRLCCDCADARIDRSGTVPQEWHIDN